MKRVARALDVTRATRSRIGKEQALAEALVAVARDEDDADGLGLATATRFAVGRALPVGDPRAVGVGWSSLLDVIVSATSFDAEVVRACARVAGDLGEAFGLLMARAPNAAARPGLRLRDVAALFEALAASGNRVAKQRCLGEAFARATPTETKYLAKVLVGGLRIGAMEGVLEGAIARAFGAPIEDVRRALSLVTDPGIVAVLARDGRLAEARLEIGRPVAYMLATPIETIATPIDATLHVLEDKIDGVRAQVHKLGSDVAIFARGLDRVGESFPEVLDAFRFVRGQVVLDGELVVLGLDRRPRPFQALQSRLHRMAPTAEVIAEAPVTFVAYDLLADDEGSALSLPWAKRRERLEAYARTIGARSGFALNPYVSAGDTEHFVEHLDLAFAAARGRGHEGVVLKRVDAPYEAGRRGQSWIKVKRAFATLDVVITAAEEGHGRRAGALSDYTFAVWRGEELVNVGKAYSGLTDDEIERMTRRLERMTTERFGGARLVRPEIVLEVAFDGIQRSKRHKSGYALRFPRIVRIRDDKAPGSADRVEAVEALFQSQLATGHREDAPAATKTRPAPKQRAPSAQLSLFAEEMLRGRRGG